MSHPLSIFLKFTSNHNPQSLRQRHRPLDSLSLSFCLAPSLANSSSSPPIPPPHPRSPLHCSISCEMSLASKVTCSCPVRPCKTLAARCRRECTCITHNTPSHFFFSVLLFSLGQTQRERGGGRVDEEDELTRLDLRTSTPDYTKV